ncbi:radical SAM family heme chaperone HemW [Anaerostipes sp.]|uniref:radical SAM family heme chaperone HemW n=1 Tax=Anaerostipes sp. TaxID=1872530 RepID=UPI0025B8D418|nr:radical SAM family heme chaperone HemW [Anaerostipes sp.]MBS7009797.1 oxygen-independent coproporphyrinogen III oxidase [Anaerostipes sp.]
MKTRELELYLHIPFCKRKCSYCDFCSFPAGDSQISTYMKKLEQEVSYWGERLSGWTVSTVFIGGGTPSLIPAGQIESLMSTVRDSFSCAENLECSIEANPGTVTKEKLEVYQESGINRISFGLQSTREEELKILGRIHSFEDFVSGYYTARECGFKNINVDLMSAVPCQTLKTMEQTLIKTAELKPEHISVYSLIIEEGTPFYEDKGLGRLLPSEDEDAAMYELTGELLGSFGYERYELSNYAKPGFECRHNCGYWNQTPYLGLGLAASSYFEGKRFSNPSGMEEYLSTQNPGRYFAEERSLSEEEEMEEYMFLGLRMTKGISKADFLQRFGRSIREVYQKPIRELSEKGLLKQDSDRIWIPKQALFLSNQVMAEFLL